MPSTGVLDTVLNTFTAAISGNWGPSLNTIMLPLLLALFVLQFGMVAVEMAITADPPSALTHGMLGLLRVGIVWAIYVHAFDWANDIVTTGTTIGGNISGFSLSPSGVLTAGQTLSYIIFHAKALGGWLLDPIESLEFLAISIFVYLCWLFAALVYMGALLEGALLIYVAPLLIAFTPLSWTFGMLLAWGMAVLRIAFKLALILMTLAVATTLANDWVASAGATSTTFTTDIWNLVVIITEAIMFTLIIWVVPTKISGLAAGGAAWEFGEAMWDMGAGLARSTGSYMFQGPSGGGGGGGYGGSYGGGYGGGYQGSGAQSSSATSPTNQQAAATQLAQQVQTKLTS